MFYKEEIIQLYKSAKVEFESKNYNQSEDLLRKGLKLNIADSYCLRLLSNVYKEQGNIKKEEQVLDVALKYHPNNSYFIGRMAKVYINTNRFDEADKLTDKKLELNEKPGIERELKLENYQVSYSYKMDISKARGDNAGFRSWSKKFRGIQKEILGLSNDSKLTKKLQSQISEVSKATIALSSLNAEQCLRISEEMLKQNPKDSLASWFKAKSHFLQGDYAAGDKEAKQRYTMKLSQNETDDQKKDKQISLYLLRAQADMGLGKSDAAHGWLNAVSELDGNNNAVRGLLTAMHIDKGDLVTANDLTVHMEEKGDIYALKYRGLLQIKSEGGEKIKQGAENLYKFLSETPDMLLLKYMRTLASADIIDRKDFNNFIKQSTDLGQIAPKLKDQLTANGKVDHLNLLSMKTIEAANLSEPALLERETKLQTIIKTAQSDFPGKFTYENRKLG